MTLPLVALVLAAPLLLLASALVALAAHGPLGWAAGAALVAAVGLATRAGCRRCLAWWASTKAPVRPGRGALSGGTGPGAAGPPGRRGGTSPG